MFKVMIADDESWIRKGLKAMIEWERLGLVCDTEASDGLEALQLTETDMPDILITDVRMPGIDGLELGQRLLELSPRLKVLIISGYSEFAYVKAAIQMDAVSYILKPINPVELNGTLEKAVERLKAENKEKLMASHLPGYLEKLTADLCRGRAGLPLIQTFSETLQLENMMAENMACLLFHYDDSHYDAETMAQLLEQAEASVPPGVKRLIIWRRGSSRIDAVILAKDRPGLLSYLKRLLISLKRRNVSAVWASVGDQVDAADCAQLSRSYREALNMSERHAFNRTEEIVLYSPGEEEPSAYKYPVHLQKKLGDLVKRNDRTGSEAALEEISGYYRSTEGATLKHARSFFLTVVTDTVKNMLTQPSFHEGIVEKGFDFCLNIDQYDDLQRMADWLRDYLHEIIHTQETANQRDVHRNILCAADYIREHYAEEISLNSISTRYYITSTYFSSMFKEIVGENFVEFLTRIRMEKAKEMLVRSTVKVGQIGEMVGYTDGRYFSKLFKKQTGLMPTEYRQSRSDHRSRESKESR